MNFKFLNSKESKKIMKLIKDQWDAEIKTEYALLQDAKNKIYFVTRSVEKVDFKNLRINSLGLYILEIKNEIRLSVEGSQLIGPLAKKNVIEISKEVLVKWLKGEDLKLKAECSGFVIIKHKKDYFGTGKVKQDNILNLLPKTRRIKNPNM